MKPKARQLSDLDLTETHMPINVEFPSWPLVLHSFLHKTNSEQEPGDLAASNLRKLKTKLETIRKELTSSRVESIPNNLHRNVAKLDTKERVLRLTQLMEEYPIRPQEFYTITDLATGEFSTVENRIEEVLGIQSSYFTVQRICNLIPDQHLIHPDDVYHVMRYRALAYILLSTPGFAIKEMSDHFWVKFRLNTSKSSIETFRDAGYVVVERRCYVPIHLETGKANAPDSHLDRWAIYDQKEFSRVEFGFVSSPHQNAKMNALAYLYNAMLINISPKYTILLDERNKFDRGKTIASSLNDQIAEKTKLTEAFDEQGVLDCFTKTIRKKVGETISSWEQREDTIVLSDTEAVRFSQKLGITPVPDAIRSVIISECKSLGSRA
jgi:hypothetical protein